VTNNDPRALAITRIEHSRHFQVAVAAVDPGKVFEVTVRAADGTPVGRYDESLHLHTDLPGEVSIELPLHLWVKPDVYANPEALDFGLLPSADLKRGGAAGPSTQTFFLTRRGGPFTIEALDYDATVFEVTHSPAGPSARYRFDVRLLPSASGRERIGGSLRVTTNDPRFPEVVVPLRALPS
jgi:hypothetical protein